MPIIQNYFERLSHSLYDTLVIPQDVEPRRIRLFLDPVGPNGRNFSHTNMLRAGCLPEPQKFIVQRLRIQVLDADPQDVESFGRVCFTELIIHSKPYWSGPASDLLFQDQVMKALSSANLEAEKETDLFAQYLKALDLGKVDADPIDGCCFSVDMSFEQILGLKARFTARLHLDGQLFRPIQ